MEEFIKNRVTVWAVLVLVCHLENVCFWYEKLLTALFFFKSSAYGPVDVGKALMWGGNVSASLFPMAIASSNLDFMVLRMLVLEGNLELIPSFYR